MKSINIQICGYDPHASQFTYGAFLLDHLRKFYHVHLSEHPDYIFFHERDTEHLRHPNAIRIFYTGENVSPDFNVCDYAISFDLMEFGDRHFRLPLYMAATLYDQEDIELAGDLTFEHVPPMTIGELRAKKSFCSFAYSNHMADPHRKELFDALSTYKRVNACGDYLNNMDGWTTRKLAFKREHKFSIACENSSRVGYVTEKLPVGFAARTIPIYFGDPTVGREFNTKRFINTHEYPDFKSVVARVKEIDQNDEEYLRIVNEPVLAEGFHYNDTLAAFDDFLRTIFDQPLQKARRRTINAAYAKNIDTRDKLLRAHGILTQYVRNIVKPLKNIPVLKTVLQKLKRRSLFS